MKEKYKLSEIAEKRLEESNLKIDQDNSKLSRIGEMALYSTVPDKNGEEVRLTGVDSNKINKINEIAQDDELFENFKREMNLTRLCNINDRLPRMLSLGHDDFHVFGVDLIDRDRVGVLIKHEETEDNNIKEPSEEDFINAINEVNERAQNKYEKSSEEEEIDKRFRAVMSKMAYQIAQSEIDEQDQGLER